LDKSLKAKVLFEISQIDKLLDDSDPLLDTCKIRPPDFIEMSACAMVLYSFYNSIENIIILISKHYNEFLTNGNKWRIELLDKAFINNKERKQIFTNELQERLEEYLRFRHFIRYANGFKLEWERMEDLINNIQITWETAKENIKNFLEN